MTKEEWKYYDYNCEVSNYGRIRNKKTKIIYKQNKDSNGYMQLVHYLPISQRKNNKKYYQIRTHRAVAKIFIPNPNNLPQVNHINGDKTDNRVENLEWCDNKYNSNHAIKIGIRVFRYGADAYNSKLTEEERNYIKSHYKSHDKKYGAIPLTKKFNVTRHTITNIAKNKKRDDKNEPR